MNEEERKYYFMRTHLGMSPDEIYEVEKIPSLTATSVGIMGDMYKKCKEGFHPLIGIMRTDDGIADIVVRWCPDCGAIVVDAECDDRLYAGHRMKMRLPKLAKEHGWVNT